MFKIAGLSADEAGQLGHAAADDPLPAHLCRYARWQGPLASGLIHLDATAAGALDLAPGDHGLSTFAQCLVPADRDKVLAIFEQAARAPQRFCFSSTIRASRHAIFCVGHSHGHGERAGGALEGIFFFPPL